MLHFHYLSITEKSKDQSNFHNPKPNSSQFNDSRYKDPRKNAKFSNPK